MNIHAIYSDNFHLQFKTAVVQHNLASPADRVISTYHLRDFVKRDNTDHVIGPTCKIKQSILRDFKGCS